MTFFWMSIKLHKSFLEKLTCIVVKHKQSVQTLQFTVRSEWRVASLWKCSFRENHFLLKCIKILITIPKKLICDSLIEKWSVHTGLVTVWSKCIFVSFVNAVVSEKMTFLWKSIKLLIIIHEKLTCVSLKEKQSVHTVQLTVRSEWSVASLCKCCSFRDNYLVLKEH